MLSRARQNLETTRQGACAVRLVALSGSGRSAVESALMALCGPYTRKSPPGEPTGSLLPKQRDRG